MTQQIVVGPINKGLRTDRLPFNIDNDSFPTLINAYQWRGRIKRKRGTAPLGRLERYFDSTSSAYTGTTTNPSFTITFDGSGNANLFGPYTNATPTSFSLQSNGNIFPGSVSITGSVGPVTYTDPTNDGFLTPTGTGGPNTINYATGAILIPAQAGGTATVHFLYYPDLPVMGLEDLVLNANLFPGTLGFDTTYSYNISTMSPYAIYDVSFYKNLPSTTYNSISYTQKTTPTPTSWNGQTYQQFWTVNYENALWATNGITIPFTPTNVGMQFKPIASITYVSATNLTITITEAAASLVIGDWVFINEVTGTNNSTVNLQTGFVTAVSNNGTTTTLTVRFPFATISNQSYSNGILQYLTNRSDSTKDCLRWYDGDPTNGSATSPSFIAGNGWVNFMPPISQSSLTNFTPDDVPGGQYYLVGARMIIPYKDRLLFIGPLIQTSAVAAMPIYLQDTVFYSQNGTPYYTASFTGSVDLPTTVFNSLLTPPINSNTVQGASPASYFSDQTGFGGYITAGHARPITSAGFNEDVLILGFSNRQTRFLYTGNDLVPFNFFTINSEYGSTSTFSLITLDRGVISIGGQGIIITSQIGAERIDLEILDQIFTFSLSNNGTERICAQRDFVNEWVYFTYSVIDESDELTTVFPNQTLMYNYRDRSWGIFNETFTTYGQFRESTGFTWATVGNFFPTWSQWNQPWNSSFSNVLQPQVIAGNQQGFIFFRLDDAVVEAQSLYIRSYSGDVITCPNHSLNNGDYITITINGALQGIYQVSSPTTNTFQALGPSLPGSYFGIGTIQRMYVPYIQSKQFPVAWSMGRKTRIGPQMYLLSNTDTANSQITLLIFLSEGSTGQTGVGPAYNNLEFPQPVGVIPAASQNNSLIYSTILYTCPESTNLGLTPANTNLQMLTAQTQNQIWHRMNTSLIGDTVQVGFTMNSTQMLDINFASQFQEIELHAMILNVSPSQVLA